MINKQAVRLLDRANELEKEQEEIAKLQKLLQKRGEELLEMLEELPPNCDLAERPHENIAYFDWCKLYVEFIKRSKKNDYEYDRLKYNAVQLATKGVIE
ncbi:MAG: hypothetical protein ABF807_06465 [Liquorilactobacillus nagelii]|uniref:hypothetical protein n=1 Tax=Liquorilactobacillus nagelii TaxID=82688 RepID=UPI0039ED033F